MKITWEKDPRVPISGQWTVSGKILLGGIDRDVAKGKIENISEINNNELTTLINFLNTFLVDRERASVNTANINYSYADWLKEVYHIEIRELYGDSHSHLYIRVPFEHADTLLNFISTMGWEYIIQGN